MIVTLPAVIPLAAPVVAPTVATDVLLLVQVPPGVVFVRVAVAPAQTAEELGTTTDGRAATVTVLVTLHPATVYDMTAVPTATPDTTPEPLTGAMETLPLLHDPPEVALDNVVLLPTQMITGVEGDIAAGLAFTVKVAVTKQVPTA